MSVWVEFIMNGMKAFAFICVALHLLVLVFQSSLFCDLFIPAWMTDGNIFHLFILALPVVSTLCLLPSSQVLKKPGWLSALLCGLVYAAVIVFSSAHLCSGISDWSRVVLIPLTVLSLTFCAPLLLTRSAYRSIFWILAVLFALHTIFILFCMVTDTTSAFGRSLVQGPGREKSLFGLILLRTDGLYGNPNTLGSFLMYLPAVLLSEAMIAGRFLSSAATVLLSIVSMGLLGSFSRGAQLTALLGAMFPAVQLSKRSKVLSTVASLFLVSFMVFAMQPSMNSSRQTGQSKALATTAGIDTVAVSEVSSGRSDLWRKTLERIDRSSALGTGLVGADSAEGSPHNFLLANLLYFGCFGTISLIAMLAVLGKSIWNRTRQYPELMPIAGVLAAVLLIHGQIEYVLTYPLFLSNSLFWFLSGYACFSSFDLGSRTEQRNISTDKSAAYANSGCPR